MENILKTILLASDVPEHEQLEWKQISDDMISDGLIERLTEKGLFQAVGLLGWHFATDSVLSTVENYSELEWSNLVERKAPQMDEIRMTIAMSSGIHPTIVHDMTKAGTDYFMNLYTERAKV